jgi:metal-responsive CopG/Arc/MetJ family transcriptional regulator
MEKSDFERIIGRKKPNQVLAATLGEEMLGKFNAVCDEQGLNRSDVVRTMVREFISLYVEEPRNG